MHVRLIDLIMASADIINYDKMIIENDLFHSGWFMFFVKFSCLNKIPFIFIHVFYYCFACVFADSAESEVNNDDQDNPDEQVRKHKNILYIPVCSWKGQEDLPMYYQKYV